MIANTMAVSQTRSAPKFRHLVPLFIAGSLIGAASQTRAEVPIRVTSDLNMRTCPSTECTVNRVLPAGTCHTALERVNGGAWVRIRSNGKIGFVATRYTHPGCEEPARRPPPPPWAR